MRKQKGSFTIEAILWVPLLICLLTGVIKEGILFYEKSVNSEKSKELLEWDVVSKFYEVWMLKEMGEDANE